MPSSLDFSLDGGLGGPVLESSIPKEVQQDLFGTDILFTDDLQVGSNGDYITVKGIENLRMAIWRRLITRPGEFKYRPQYGVGIMSFVKKPLTKANLETLTRRIRENLAQERRISKIVSIDVLRQELDGDPGIVVTIVFEAGGRVIRPAPFSFSRKAA